MKKIEYKINDLIAIEEIIDLLYQSNYLPIDNMSDKSRISKMFSAANLIVSAWYNDKLIGIARSLCDFSYCCYLSDICVHSEYRNLHVGYDLIMLTKEQAGKECKLILHSSASAIGFYEKIGMKRINDAFIIQREV